MSIKLKLLRVQANLTLEDLARTVEMTRGYLSKIERGLATPSIGVALKLANALNVSVEELFGDAGQRDAVEITRATTSKTNPEVRGAPRVVAGSSPDHRMLAVILKPGEAKGRRHPMSRHQGEELLFVLMGSVGLQLADRKEWLGPGDCAHFNCAIPHKITAGSDDAEVLIVISS
jgi:transcriptional regulator with XRE-family HTH domain